MSPSTPTESATVRRLKTGLQTVALSRRYGDHAVAALAGVDLTIAPGEWVALMGPSGCGKSTLLNILGTLDTPDAGQVLLDGQDLFALDEGKRTRLRRETFGFVFQFFNLLSTLTVRENVALPLDLGVSCADPDGAVNAMLEAVSMSHRADFFPAQLSGGEMQRVAIARALVHGPPVILADEPTGNLDSENGRIILELLSKLCRENGQTVLMATHSEEAARWADRILRMRDGRIVDAAIGSAP